jgi:hypothetical protein
MGPPILLRLLTVLAVAAATSAAAHQEAFRRDPGHPQWHHGAFHDVEDSVRADVRRMLHTRAEVLPITSSPPPLNLSASASTAHEYKCDSLTDTEFR